MKNHLSSLNLPIDVVGVGNAIVDIIVQVEDKFLVENKINKGAMTLIDETQAQDLYFQGSRGLQTSGGSAANTLAGLAQLGSKTAFIGRVRNDELGSIFTDDIRSVGAIFETPPAEDGPSTARCMIFVTPDAQRTMCTYLGASVKLSPVNLDLSIVKEAKILYLEGYLWDNQEAKKAFLKAASISRDSGGKVALSLSDGFCVDRHRSSFLELIDNDIDILFANEAEITSLYNNSDISDAVKEVQKRVEISAITLGENGSIIISSEHAIKIAPYNLGRVIDTTGAGDLYAAGFLYGYTQGRSLEESAKIGSLCSGQVITQLGSRSKVSLPDLVDKYLTS